MSLEERIDALTDSWQPVKKKMFTGYGYMINGNLAFGTHRADELIVRAGEDTAEELLKRSGIREFDMKGKPMKNWFMAGPAAYKTDEELLELLKTGRDFAQSLPPK